jgi:hypothetical protein
MVDSERRIETNVKSSGSALIYISFDFDSQILRLPIYGIQWRYEQRKMN